MNSSEAALSTRCAHAGSTRRGQGNQPYQHPIVQTSLFRLGNSADLEAVFEGISPGHVYTRFGNPTVEALAEVVADLEGGAGALVTSSGNAATLCAVTAALRGRSGPLLSHPGIYGGSVELMRTLAEIFRVPVEVADPDNAGLWAEAVGRAGAVLVETPSNPLMRLVDLEETVRLAREVGAPVIVDNTVATPLNQKPFEWGADWIVHSLSKYLNGHSDLIGGCVVKREALSDADRSVHKNLGGTYNALEAWLAIRGIRTFTLRMRQHNGNAEAVVRWLHEHPAVATVHFAGSGGPEQRRIFERQMTHHGALVSFELHGGAEAARHFLDRLELVVSAVSLGGMESLATRPAISSHRGMSPGERLRAGVTDSLVRLSVGVEDLHDLLADLDQALR